MSAARRNSAYYPHIRLGIEDMGRKQREREEGREETGGRQHGEEEREGDNEQLHKFAERQGEP